MLDKIEELASTGGRLEVIDARYDTLEAQCMRRFLKVYSVGPKLARDCSTTLPYLEVQSKWPSLTKVNSS